jgi:uncharacterized membrane protein YdjX (TVP38/TMEM64 family)
MAWHGTHVLTEQLTVWVAPGGGWGAGVYIGVYVVTTLALLPTTPLNVAAGVLFGPGWGLLWTVVGAWLAAVVGFALARGVGQAWVKRWLGRRWGRWQRYVHRRGGVVLFWLRLLPVVPYGVVNYGAGLLGVSWRDYLLTLVPGTVLGVAPVVWLGSGGSWFWLGFVGAGLLWWGRRRWFRR